MLLWGINKNFVFATIRLMLVLTIDVRETNPNVLLTKICK